jgi:hypothetical protein
MGMTFYTRGLALDSRHPRFIPLRVAYRRPRLVVTTTSSVSPVVKYHGLGRLHLQPPVFLMRPLLNGGTLGGPVSSPRGMQLESENPREPGEVLVGGQDRELSPHAHRADQEVRV